MTVIDWSDLSCSSGPAAPRVPDVLNRLFDEDVRRAGAARRDLAGLCRTQMGQLPHSAARGVVPHLADALRDGRCGPNRAAIIKLIADVSLGDPSAYLPFGLDPRHSNLAWLLQANQRQSPAERAVIGHQRAIRAAVVDAHELLLDALDDDLDVRTNAAFTLAFIPEVHDESVPRLTTRLADESAPRAAASMLIALGILGGEIPPTPNVVASPVPIARATALALASRGSLTDETAQALEQYAAAIDPAKTMTGWPWYDGRLRTLVEQALWHASFERGDVEAHARLVDRDPRAQGTGANLLFLMQLGRDRRQYRRLARHELTETELAVIEAATGQASRRLVLDSAGVFAAEDARVQQMDAQHVLAEVVDDDALWRILSDAADGVSEADVWCSAVANARDATPLAIVMSAANGPFQLYRFGARDGVPAGDARWDGLNQLLRHTISTMNLGGELGHAAARYVIEHGLNLGLFLLEWGRARGVDPATPWVQHVRAEVEKQWASGMRVESLKEWAAHKS